LYDKATDFKSLTHLRLGTVKW